MQRVKRWVLGLSVVVLVGVSYGGAAVPERYVLMVPERFRLVQFGADVSALCEIPLITYDADESGVRLFSWSPSQGIWRPLDAASFSANVGEGRLGTVLLVGREADLPASLTEALTGTPVARVNTLDLAQVANSLHAHLGFSGRQWKQLAAKHGLTLKDRNAAKRKQGRYGSSTGFEADVEVEQGDATTDPSPVGPVRIMGAQVEEVTLPEEPDTVPVAPVAELVVEVEKPIVMKPEGAPATVALEPVEKGMEVQVAPIEEPVLPEASTPEVLEEPAEVAPAEEEEVLEEPEVAAPAEEEEAVDPAGVQGPELPSEKG